MFILQMVVVVFLPAIERCDVAVMVLPFIFLADGLPLWYTCLASAISAMLMVFRRGMYACLGLFLGCFVNRMVSEVALAVNAQVNKVNRLLLNASFYSVCFTGEY